jgi:hypothetical protein
MTTRRIMGSGIIALALLHAAAPAAAQSSTPAMTPLPPVALAVPTSPEALQAAKELVSVISSNVISDAARSVTGEAWPAMQALLVGQHPGLSDSTLAEMRAEFERQQVDLTRRLLADAPALYARYFSADELRTLKAFYATPAGAKTLEVMPSLTAQLMAMSNPTLSGYQNRLDQAFNRILRLHGYAQ